MIFNFCIIFNCNCTNCSAIMAAILDFTGEAAMSLSEKAFPATGNIIGTNIVKITPCNRSQNMAINAALNILVTILDSGDRIAIKECFAALDNP